MLYVDHIDGHGREFFEKVCELDLEGIVAKRKNSQYRSTGKPSPYWIKVKNPEYSQAEGEVRCSTNFAESQSRKLCS
jgi:bifunctional non-homologous end joining protein LigD